MIKKTVTPLPEKPWIPKGFKQTFVNPTHMNCLQCCRKIKPFPMSNEKRRKKHFLQDPRNHLPVLLAKTETKSCKFCGTLNNKDDNICNCGNDKFW
jgi:hypothetical protein